MSGGRAKWAEFLSTPSARRATSCNGAKRICRTYFYPRPPRGGRHGKACRYQQGHRISIHALREEGDSINSTLMSELQRFLSTPSARRATALVVGTQIPDHISIHALREEGDQGRQ